MKISRNLRLPILLLLLLPIQLACGKVKEPVFEAIDDVRINGITNTGAITADVKVRIRNDNRLSYSGNEVEMTIYYKGIQVASGKAAASFQIPSKDTVSFLMNVEFFPDSLLDDSYEILYQDSIPLRISVSGKFGTLRIHSNAEIEHQLKTDELLDLLMKENLGKKQVQVEKTILKNFNAQTSTVVSYIRFKNTMPLDLDVSSMVVDIYSDAGNRDRISTWRDTLGFLIPQDRDTVLAPEFEINTLSTAMTGIFKTISGNNIYYASGHAIARFRSRSFKVPIKFKFRFDPLRQTTEVVE